MSEENTGRDIVRCPAKNLVIDRDNAHRAYWLAMIPATHTPEDVQRPEYFGFFAGQRKLRVGDVIEVQAEDQSWWGELLVRAIPSGLNMVVTRKRFLETFDIAELPEGYEIKYLGTTGKHTLFFNDNPVQGGFETPEEASIKAMQMAGRRVETERASDAIVAAATPRKKPGPKPKSAENTPVVVAE